MSGHYVADHSIYGLSESLAAVWRDLARDAERINRFKIVGQRFPQVQTEVSTGVVNAFLIAYLAEYGETKRRAMDFVPG